MEPTDFELLAAWRDGNAKSGNVLFDRYFDVLFRFFRNKVQDGAEDLVQQTFLALVRSRDRFRGDSSFRTYLFTAARSKLYSYLERRGRDGIIDYGVTSCADLGISPSGAVGREEQHKHLLLALRRLPIEMQVALELYYWEELGVAEIGEVLETPVGTVKSRLQRARTRLDEIIIQLSESEDLLKSTMDNFDKWARELQAHLGPKKPDAVP